MKTVRLQARRLAALPAFADDDKDDLIQELVLDLVIRLESYDPEKAKLTTFGTRVIKNRAANLVAARFAQRRDPRRNACSLDEPCRDDQLVPVRRIDTITEDEYRERMGGDEMPRDVLLDLRLDLESVIGKLDPELQTVCRLLTRGTVADVARALGTSRASVYERMREVRACFAEAGLDQYLVTA